MSGVTFDRRTFVKGVASIGSVGIAGCIGDDTGSIIVTQYGGAFEERMEDIAEIYEEETDVTVELSPYTTVAELREQAEDPDIDVALLDDFDIIRAGDEVFAPIDQEIVTLYDDLYESAYLPDDIGVTHIFGSYGLCYNTDVWDAEDFDSWTNLWDDRFEGEIAIMDDWAPFMVIASMAWGGDERNMDPLWDRLPELSENVEVFYEEFAQPEFLIPEGQVTVASWFDGRAHALREAGEPVEYILPEEGGTIIRGAAAPMRNSDNLDAAQEFINYLLIDDAQQLMAEDLFYGPTNAQVELQEDVAETVEYGEDDLANLVVPDWEYILANRDEWSAQWSDGI